MRSLRLLVTALFVMTLAACGGTTQDTGGMKIGVSTSASTLSASGTLTVKGVAPNHYEETYQINEIPFSVTDKPCPVGTYTWEATATYKGHTFAGNGTFSVRAGEMTQIDAFLMQQTDPEPMVVVAPYTKQIEFNLPGPNSGGWGVPLKLTADVALWDNDNPDLDWFIYTWKHSCNDAPATALGFFLPLDVIYYNDRGHMNNAARVSTTFTSFCQGVETITFESVNTNNLLCPDNGCSLTSTVSFQIEYKDQGYLGALSVNFAPVVACDSVENAEPVPGGVVGLSATASDREQDGMTYEWSDNGCGGSFASPASLSTTWTAPSANCKECVLKLNVSDTRGASNSGSITVKTAPADLSAGCAP